MKVFGQIDVVAVNAGVAEVGQLLDDREVDEAGRPKVSVVEMTVHSDAGQSLT